MPLNLLMDTTRADLMLALATDEGVIARSQEPHTSFRYHSAVLLPTLQGMLAQHGFSLKEITGVAVNLGPGSFTGIRTGLTVARLMGQFAPVKTYGFNTFQLMAGNEAFQGRPITVLLNAFRNQHYRAALQVEQTGEIHWQDSPVVLPNSDMAPIDTEVCLIERSLLTQLTPLPLSYQVIEEAGLFSPEVMDFFLRQRAADFEQPWSALKPMYLQMPHITLSKAMTSS